MIAAGAKSADITAALTNVTLETNLMPLSRPAVLTEIRGLIEYGRPVIGAINRAALPPPGMRIEWPSWTVLPLVDIQTDEKTAITSGPANIGVSGTDVLTWAGGNDISLQAVQRSNPSFVEAWLRAAAEQFARKTEQYVVTTLLNAAGVVAPPATFLDSIEALFAAMDPATTPAGSVFLAMSMGRRRIDDRHLEHQRPRFLGRVDLAQLGAALVDVGWAQHVRVPPAPRQNGAVRHVQRGDLV